MAAMAFGMDFKAAKLDSTYLIRTGLILRISPVFIEEVGNKMI
ncbi:hypothetical protein [Chryseomicrobium palamuruense]